MYKNIGLAAAVIGLSACVTINIYFPAAAAEKAADKIIDEVWQLKDAQSKPTETAPASQTDKPSPNDNQRDTDKQGGAK